jgi:acetolactate synthase I/II/III large subunit
MYVYEAMARELRNSGVEVVFGLCGSDTVKLAAHLELLGVRFIGTRHESQAVAMADGYARVSGNVGVAIANRGPGFTNALTSLICAAKAKSPVVVISGDTAIGVADSALARLARADPKDVAQADICAAAGVPAAVITSPDSAVADVRAVLNYARSGVSVALHIPTDVLDGSAGVAGPTVVLPETCKVPEPAPDEIAAVADIFESGWAARKPVILAGRGAFRSGARSTLERLAELTGAVLATSLMNRSFFSGSPFDIGVCGTLSTSVAIDLLVQADLIVVFGASLNKFTTDSDRLLRGARIIQVDSDPAAFGKHGRAPDMALRGDAKAVSAALAAELDRRGYTSTGFRRPEVARMIKEHSYADQVRDESTSTALDPRILMLRLDEILPSDRTLVVEAGDHLRFSCKYLGVPPPPSFVFPMESFAIGLGMGAAIGAAIGDPTKLTVLEVGDGGLMMTLGDLETAIRYQVPVVVIVSNNGGLGSEMKALAAAHLSADHASFHVPSLAAVARAMGAAGLTINAEGDLDAVRERLSEPLQGPLVLDCHVTPKFDAE